MIYWLLVVYSVGANKPLTVAPVNYATAAACQQDIPPTTAKLKLSYALCLPRLAAPTTLGEITTVLAFLPAIARMNACIAQTTPAAACRP